MDAKTYATAVALILVGVGVGYVLMGPFPETTEAQEDGGGGKYDPPHSSQVSFLNYNSSNYGRQYQSFCKEGNRVTRDCIDSRYQVIFYYYDMNIIAEYRVGWSEGTIQGNTTNKCADDVGEQAHIHGWIDTELPQEPVRVGLLYSATMNGVSPEYRLQIRTF